MDYASFPLFQALFNTDIPRIILKANSPDFDIIDYNEAFALTANVKYNIRGESLWTPYDPKIAGGDEGALIKSLLKKAVDEQVKVSTHPFRYDIEKTATQKREIRWWQLEIIPIPPTGAENPCLLVTTLDITEKIAAQKTIKDSKQREQELAEELAATNEKLLASNEELLSTVDDLDKAQKNLQYLNKTLENSILERTKDLSESVASLQSLVMNAHYPLMILRGEDWIIEVANQSLVNLWDKTIDEVTGNRLMQILPEIENQPFPKLLRQVYQTGIGYGEKEQIFHYNSPTGPATKYVSFYYDPMFDSVGNVSGLIVSAEDITENVAARVKLEESIQNEQYLNEQISAVNEELAATNEELISSNEELLQSQYHLERINQILAESENRFRLLITQAPVGICVIRVSDLHVQEVNNAYLELVGRTRNNMQGLPIWDAVPEAKPAYAQIMKEVIESGKAFNGHEHEIKLLRNGNSEIVYVDFVYEPVADSKGTIILIMVIAIDVTEKVQARKNIEDVEERIRLALEAAEIGTYDHNLLTNTMISSTRTDKIFGYEYPVPRSKYLHRFYPEDIDLADAARKLAYETGQLLYEARIIHDDDSIHWIKVQGRVYFEENIPVRILGTVLDITEFKRLQQQKDDFISIASHELKTPITSLKASLQLLERMKENPSPTIFPKLIDQSSRSMRKVTELVDDLLNVSQMGQGDLQLKKGNFNISDMILESTNHIKMANQYDLIIEGDLDLELYADEHRVSQVVINLVNNAVKYAPSSKKIIISIAKEEADARISVKDFGNGVPSKKIPFLFERYFRAEETGEHVSGLGLGLYICAEIVRKHGGKIGVDSEVNKGSEFWFTIPFSS